MKNKIHLIIGAVLIFILGIYFGRMFTSDRLPPYYGCNQIARWHADYLMREYEVEFNTNPENPRAQFNQKASDLNSMILSLCFLDPEDLNPGLKPIVDDMVSGKYEK
jgi:hypothetical protein